jgi:hypothetical protein
MFCAVIQRPASLTTWPNATRAGRGQAERDGAGAAGDQRMLALK